MMFSALDTRACSSLSCRSGNDCIDYNRIAIPKLDTAMSLAVLRYHAPMSIDVLDHAYSDELLFMTEFFSLIPALQKSLP